MIDFVQPLINVGAVGGVLAWVLWRTDRRLERLERAIDRLTRAQTLALVAHESSGVRQQAQALLAELASETGT
jgi:hypothetical protein